WQGPGTANLEFLKLQPVDDNGNSVYPIYLNKPLKVAAHFLNNQNEMVTGQLFQTIKLSKYGSFAGCAWNEINTHGLMANVDAGESDIPCPLAMGEHDMIVTLDFSKWKTIISLLDNDAPYQLELTLTDHVS
ncbi:hypothetical protein PFISCL1PPCAC_17893, partial [Pristionchus fissidentatus]